MKARVKIIISKGVEKFTPQIRVGLFKWKNIIPSDFTFEVKEDVELKCKNLKLDEAWSIALNSMIEAEKFIYVYRMENTGVKKPVIKYAYK